MNATVMVKGEMVWEAEGGQRRDGAEQDYNVYSVAKMLTGLAYARLAAEEGLDIDLSARSLDPDLPQAYDAATRRHLLTHT